MVTDQLDHVTKLYIRGVFCSNIFKKSIFFFDLSTAYVIINKIAENTPGHCRLILSAIFQDQK